METLKHPANRRVEARLFRGMQNARQARALHLERVMGIEPTYEAWEAAVLPLNYTRSGGDSTCSAALPARVPPGSVHGPAAWQVLATQAGVGRGWIEAVHALGGARFTACSARMRSFAAAALAASAVGETSEYTW